MSNRNDSFARALQIDIASQPVEKMIPYRIVYSAIEADRRRHYNSLDWRILSHERRNMIRSLSR